MVAHCRILCYDNRNIFFPDLVGIPTAVEAQSQDDYVRKTRFAYYALNVTSAPLLAAYNFIGVILYRDLMGTPLHVTVLTMLKPVVAVLALYWSYQVSQRCDRLRANIVWSGILGRLPFLVFPFVNAPWALIVPAAFYMLLWRGGIPAWMEVFKRNLTDKQGSQLFSNATAIGYLEGILLTLGMGIMMDHYPGCWRWIFPAAALCGIAGSWWQMRLPIHGAKTKEEQPVRQHSFSLWQAFVQPWRDSLGLVKDNEQFRRFQWGYMISGGAMMIMQPALPIFFVDYLGVSYTELGVALSLCKGVGYAATARLWAAWFNRIDFFIFSSAIFACVAFFPLLLLLAPLHFSWLYISYCFYGVAQAGSELCWHLSGPAFSKDKSSSLYSSVNVTSVGIRGLFAPPVGAAILLMASPIAAFGLSVLMTCTGAAMMWHWRPLRATARVTTT